MHRGSLRADDGAAPKARRAWLSRATPSFARRASNSVHCTHVGRERGRWPQVRTIDEGPVRPQDTKSRGHQNQSGTILAWPSNCLNEPDHLSFLLAYRALAREIHLKRSTLEYWDAHLRKSQNALDLAPPLARLTMNALLTGSRKGVADLTSHKDDYDRLLVSGDYSNLRAHVIELSQPPPVMCSGGIIPEHTFLGERLIDVLNHRERLGLLSFSSFADTAAGFVVFAWVHDGSNYCDQLTQSLKRLPPQALAAPLIRFFFECCENVHMQPSWWHGLSASVQDKLVARMDGSSEFMPRDRARNFHSDDGVSYGNWHVVRRYDVGT